MDPHSSRKVLFQGTHCGCFKATGYRAHPKMHMLAKSSSNRACYYSQRIRSKISPPKMKSEQKVLPIVSAFLGRCCISFCERTNKTKLLRFCDGKYIFIYANEPFHLHSKKCGQGLEPFCDLSFSLPCDGVLRGDGSKMDSEHSWTKD